MGESVTHTGNLRPRDSRLAAEQIGGQRLDRLTDLDEPQRGPRRTPAHPTDRRAADGHGSHRSRHARPPGAGGRDGSQGDDLRLDGAGDVRLEVLGRDEVNLRFEQRLKLVLSAGDADEAYAGSDVRE